MHAEFVYITLSFFKYKKTMCYCCGCLIGGNIGWSAVQSDYNNMPLVVVVVVVECDEKSVSYNRPHLFLSWWMYFEEHGCTGWV